MTYPRVLLQPRRARPFYGHHPWVYPGAIAAVEGEPADGEETLKQIADWHPDVILLDIMMPKISGFEVCKRLRADPATRGIAVLMITALDQPSDVDRALDAGTDDFVRKPINKSELLLRVRSALRCRQYKQQLDRALAYIEAVERGVP